MFWQYVRLQLFVLLCGIVGPIFLVLYFASGANPDLQWFFWAGLVITAFDVLAPLAITAFRARSAEKTAALEERGVLALAHITGLSETGTTINDQPLIKLRLHIEGPDITPFDAGDRVLASVLRVPNLYRRQLVVLVDPATQEFEIDWDRSAWINGLVPAQFMIQEENKTYDLSGQAGPLMEILYLLKAHGIPLDRMSDIRSNPALRSQVQAIVRRAAAEKVPSAPTPASAPPQPQQSIAQRLQELETLRATGAVSEQEYTAKRQQIIAEL